MIRYARRPPPGQIGFDGSIVEAPARARPLFDGKTYEPQRDQQRLARQLEAVRRIMLDYREHTLAEMAQLTGASEASVSARIRDLRKPRFGSYTIMRRRVAGGLYGYTMLMSP